MVANLAAARPPAMRFWFRQAPPIFHPLRLVLRTQSRSVPESINGPARIAMGAGVLILKFSHGGVSVSKLAATANLEKTPSSAAAARVRFEIPNSHIGFAAVFSLPLNQTTLASSQIMPLKINPCSSSTAYQ